MAVPVWVPGQVLTSSDVNNWLAPNAVIKSSNQSVTSSTVLVNDTALVLALAANAGYIIQLFFDYEGANGGDLKIGFTVPAGATLRAAPSYLSGTVAVTWNELTQANTTYIARGNGAGAANSVTTVLTGTVTTSSTPGNLQVQWAQGTSSATSTIVHAGSSMMLTRAS